MTEKKKPTPKAAKPAETSQTTRVAKLSPSSKSKTFVQNTPRVIKTGLITLFIVLMPVLIFSIGLYVFHWEDPITEQIVRVVPYPAAVVNYSAVTYYEFRQDTAKVAYFYQKQEEASEGEIPALELGEIESLVLGRLIDEKIIAQEARKRNLNVSQKEIDQEYQKIITQAESENNLATTLDNYYDYSPQEFKEKALYPFLLRLKLDLALEQDSVLKEEARQKAIEIHGRLQNEDEDFAAIAKEFSDHPSHLKAGDTGYINVSSLPQELQSEVKKLKIGKITLPVETDQGFYIFLLEEEHTLEEGQKQIKGRQILIAPQSVEEWLTNQKGQLLVWRFF